MVLTAVRWKHIAVPLRPPQMPGIEPIGYLSSGNCPGGGLNSEVAHLSYTRLLYELCWTFRPPDIAAFETPEKGVVDFCNCFLLLEMTM